MKTLVKSHLSILLIFLVTTLLGVQTSAQSGMFEGAQESGIYTSLSKAFDDLNKGWLQEVKELAKEDAQSLSWGNYEIVKGKGFYKKKDYEPDMFCLYDKSTGKYIIPPATRKEQELYQKHQIPAGTYWPERMFFLGSGKGSMAGAPKEIESISSS